jgi:alkaline phosphatase
MLQMLIEPKGPGVPTIAALLKVLARYPRLTANPHLRWTITGNRPDPSTFPTYPSFIWFDGEFEKTYSPGALARVALFSDDFRNYSFWLGRIELPAADRARLKAAVDRAHAMGKPVRFWDAPDSPAAWKQIMELGADWINTDHIKALSAYLAATPR